MTFAVAYDIRTFKIPNKLNVYGCIAGLAWSMINNKVEFWSKPVIGIVLPLIILIPVYALGAIGAGDIKLFCVIGSFLWLRVLKIIAGSFVLVAIYGVCKGAFFHIGRRTKICFTIPVLLSTIIYFVKEVYFGSV